MAPSGGGLPNGGARLGAFPRPDLVRRLAWDGEVESQKSPGLGIPLNTRG